MMGPGWSLKRLAFGALFARFLCPGSYNSFCWLVRLLFVLSIPSITDSDLSYYYGGSRCRDFCLLVARGASACLSSCHPLPTATSTSPPIEKQGSA
ncbi:hypothetical protein MTP99_010180 [Tenebrio molitor]|nr:hypothetical protein MTP99_010180 [Tenebrio molitor]